jgi:hypothetical protein
VCRRQTTGGHKWNLWSTKEEELRVRAGGNCKRKKQGLRPAAVLFITEEAEEEH